MQNITCSIVLYHNKTKELIPLIEQLLSQQLISKIYLIDNSSNDDLKSLKVSSKIEYVFNNSNFGYGKANNVALKRSIESGADYHIVLNPDISILDQTIPELSFYMDKNPDIGLIMPKVLYENGDLQYLCKLVPKPFDLFTRRFIKGPFRKIFEKKLFNYELRHQDFNKIMEVPNLSGCFMFLRISTLKEIGLFDERFFMYLEDTDLSRRIAQVSRTVYYPMVSVYHGYAKESYKNIRLLKYHITSAIKYFNKWGWISDAIRDQLNEPLIKNIPELIHEQISTSDEQFIPYNNIANNHNKLKVTIITVVYNNVSTIASAIESVLSQTFKNIEYIVIDGGSTDGTCDVIQNYTDKINIYISERDKGIYDALNKAITLSTGNIIGILHSDDLYQDDNVISDIVQLFKLRNPDAIYGDLVYITKKYNVFREWHSGKYKEGMFLNGWMPPHPTLFVKKEIYQKYGLFNTLFKTAADYEIMLRFIHKHHISLDYLPRTLVKMRIGGKSNQSLMNRIKANLQDRKAWKVNNLKPHFYTLWLKPLKKIFQYRFW